MFQVSDIFQFFRLFPGLMNPFQEHLQRKRFQQAVAFLIDTKMTIAEIMNTVGYENSSYFYKTFRDKYGMSPKEYRVVHKNDELLRV